MFFWGYIVEELLYDNVIIGYENMGYVVVMGKDVVGFSIGDFVGCLGCSYVCCK